MPASHILCLPLLCCLACQTSRSDRQQPEHKIQKHQSSANSFPQRASSTARPAGEQIATQPPHDSPKDLIMTGQQELGELPKALQISWPHIPKLHDHVSVTTGEALKDALSEGEIAIHVTNTLRLKKLHIAESDIFLHLEPGATIGTLHIARGVERVFIVGGTFGHIEISAPAEYWPTERYDAAWMVKDVLFHGVHVRAQQNAAFEIRGERIAIAKSQIQAQTYSVWCGGTGPLQTKDLILFDNQFTSDGPESTIRLVSVLRSVVVKNTITNTLKHNYRIHGESSFNYAADNILIGTGVMLGRLEGDRLGVVWFNRNVFYHQSPDLFNVDRKNAFVRLEVQNNTAYTDVWPQLYTGRMRENWDFQNNQRHPYQSPPTRSRHPR